VSGNPATSRRSGLRFERKKDNRSHRRGDPVDLFTRISCKPCVRFSPLVANLTCLACTNAKSGDRCAPPAGAISDIGSARKPSCFSSKIQSGSLNGSRRRARRMGSTAGRITGSSIAGARAARTLGQLCHTWPSSRMDKCGSFGQQWINNLPVPDFVPAPYRSPVGRRTNISKRIAVTSQGPGWPE